MVKDKYANQISKAYTLLNYKDKDIIIQFLRQIKI